MPYNPPHKRDTFGCLPSCRRCVSTMERKRKPEAFAIIDEATDALNAGNYRDAERMTAELGDYYTGLASVLLDELHAEAIADRS